MKYYSQYRNHELFELQQSLSGLSKRNRWVQLADNPFGTSKRVYRANNIRAKLDETADTWIGACFFAKNVMKFLRGLLCLIFEFFGFRHDIYPIFVRKGRLVAVYGNYNSAIGEIN